jgi:hypothetical protein
MISKLAIAEEEGDETLYWLDLLVGSNQCRESDAAYIADQANEIVSMLVASIKTLRGGTVRETEAEYSPWAKARAPEDGG